VKRERLWRDGLMAGGVAAVVSGIPSTAHALATGRDPREATLAAGSLLLPDERRPVALLLAAVPVHLAFSLGWGLVLARALPARPSVLAGIVAGVAIATVDLGVFGRRFPRIRALPLGPQLADHAAYGAFVASVLARRRGT
jgi:hypothetical protein